MELLQLTNHNFTDSQNEFSAFLAKNPFCNYLVDINEFDLSKISNDHFLNFAEKEHLQKILSPERAQYYRASRYILKSFIHSLCYIEMPEIKFVTNANGKPQIDPELNIDIFFNVSHSANLLVLGFSRAKNLGIDIELIRYRKNHTAIMKKMFAADEVKWIQEATSESEQNLRFLQIWSLKEACIKAIGGSVFLNGHDFEIKMLNTGVTIISPLPQWQSNKWTLQQVIKSQGFVLSVAQVSQ